MVFANAAAAILVGGKAKDLTSGVEVARRSISNGHAYEKLKGLIKFTNGDESKLERIESQDA
jgi:anthranilate phosphoribosyltransferase